MRKFLSVFLAIAMVFTMSTVAFADDTHEHVITINGNDKHQYTAYQVFKGDIATVDGVKKLTNIKWGTGVNSEGDQYADNLLNELKKRYDVYDDCKTAEDVAAVLAGFQNDSEQLKAFAAVVSEYLKTPAGTTEGNTSPYTIPITGDGYYFIMDTTSDVPKGETKSEYILQVFKDMEVNAKDDEVISEKKVMDKDDSTGETSGWQDSADYDIGDYVPFQLKATLPANYEEYKTYSMTFHDFEALNEAGEPVLARVSSSAGHELKVYIDGVELSSDYYEVMNKGSGHCTFEVVIKDLKATPAHNSSVITVEYWSVLTKDANIGATGNINKMHVTYTNDVYQGGEQGTTEDDQVIVFTYATVIDKIDKDKKPLAGAEFTLEKLIKAADGTESWVAITSVKNEAGTQFTFKGLDDGKYRLTESVVPTGYNRMEPVEFTVTASHEIEADLPKLTELKVDAKGFTANENTGVIYSQIVNREGSTLPSTGGMGTTMLYFAGALLMAAAAVMFVTRRRTSAER